MAKQSAWEKHIKEKYGNRNLTATELHSERVRLEKKHGDKIVLGMLEDMTTDEERLDKIEYEAITKVLQDASPEIKEADKNYVKAVKLERFYKSSFEFIKKVFWVVLGLLIMLAVLKYLLS